VLGVSPVALVRHEEVKAQVGPDPQTAREIPLAQFARIRTWVKYGLSMGLPSATIERRLRKA
jgi:hypothetical protein